MMSVDSGGLPYNFSAFIKVQKARSTPSYKKQLAEVLGSTIRSFVLLLLLVVGIAKFILHEKRMNSEIEKEYLDQVPGMPTRFSYQELKAATENFSKKLGERGIWISFRRNSRRWLEDCSKMS